MFTGIITAKSSIISRKYSKNGLKLTIKRPQGWDDILLGESIATNGVCLTITAIKPTNYEVFLMPETLNKTTFSTKSFSDVNLERALRLGDRLSGHIVQGHVDCVGQVRKITKDDNEYRIDVSYPKNYENLIVNKCSITIDGVSLTVASCKSDTLTVAIIPHTLKHTTLGSLKEKSQVNLEFDIIGKYINKDKEAYANC